MTQETCYTGGSSGRTSVALCGLNEATNETASERLFPAHQGQKRRLGLLQRPSL